MAINYLSNVTNLVRKDISKLEKGIFVSGHHFSFKVDWIFRRTVKHVTHYVTSFVKYSSKGNFVHIFLHQRNYFKFKQEDSEILKKKNA